MWIAETESRRKKNQQKKGGKTTFCYISKSRTGKVPNADVLETLGALLLHKLLSFENMAIALKALFP